jgi:hypothetical protein
MKKLTRRFTSRFSLFAITFSILLSVHISYSQEIRWLRITQLQSPISGIGAEYENEFPGGNANFFSWPAQYSIDQNTCHQRTIWIGCKNFYDPVEMKNKSCKVIGVNRNDAAPAMIFPQTIKLIGKQNHPTITVDDQPASTLDSYDILDEVDTNLEADRVVEVKFNTSIGISVNKKVMAFDQPNHDNYFINNYVFKNTGIYNSAGTVHSQTMDSVWFYFANRYAFAGVSCTGFGMGWGAWSSTWGSSDITHSFGENPNAPDFEMRGFYTWYGPNKDRIVTYAEDWGNPNQNEDGTMASAKYVGCVTLHADKGPSDHSDDVLQPKTNNYISPDITIFQPTASQYDEVFMADRFAAITDGHPTVQHDAIIGDNYPIYWMDTRRQTGGGIQNEFAYGPYTLAPGDSIHIVFAEVVAGLSWEKSREIGGKWIQYYNRTGTPTLVLPDDNITTDHNLYKRRWVETGRDSILQTYRNAIRNYNSGYQVTKPPPPPQEFTVRKGTNRIELSWSNNADSWPHFDGYIIYRSKDNIMSRLTVYEKIFECNKSNVVHQYNDVTALPDVDYYYYIQSKDNGTQNDVVAGKPLTSSMFWTATSIPISYRTTPAGALESYQSGNWNDANSWKSFDGSTWINPAPHIPTDADQDIAINAGHTITASTADSADQLFILLGGKLVIDTGATFHVKNSDGTDVLVNGMISNCGSIIMEDSTDIIVAYESHTRSTNDRTLENSGSITQEGTASLKFENGSRYIHNRNGGSIPPSTWMSGSTCEITGITNITPSNTNQIFSHIIWNCPNQSADLSLNWFNSNYVDTLAVKNTNWNRTSQINPSFSLSLCSNSGECRVGELIIEGNRTALAIQSSGFTNTISTGNITLSGGGLLLLSKSGGTTSLTCHSNLTIQDSGYIGTGDLVTASTILFSGDGTYNVPSNGVPIFGGPNFSVNGSLKLGTSAMTGSGNFTLNSDANLETSHSSGLDGNILVTGTKSFSKNARFVFNDSSAQMTGTLMPDTVYLLTINNISGVTLSNSVTINGGLSMENGTLSAGDNVVSYGINGSLYYQVITTDEVTHTTSNAEFPSSNGPKDLIIFYPRHITLHDSRTIRGNLDLSWGGNLQLGIHTLTAATVTNATDYSYVAMDSGGSLRLAGVGPAQKLFPVGTRDAYTPVWITNSGTTDTIAVGVVSDSTKITEGGRVKVRWNINENTPGDGNYKVKLRWPRSLEDSMFNLSNISDWKIIRLSDTTEAVGGPYTKISIPVREIARGKITVLDAFTVGTFTPPTEIEEYIGNAPSMFSLKQNYPNPFNPSTIISFEIPSKSIVTLKVFDVIGREVATIVSGELPAGNYTRQWNAQGLSGGIYFCRLKAGSFTETRKLILLR